MDSLIRIRYIRLTAWPVSGVAEPTMPTLSLRTLTPLTAALLLVACGSPTPQSAALADDPVTEAAVAQRLASAPAGIHGLAAREDGVVVYADSFGNADSQRSLYRLTPPYTAPAQKLPVSGALPAGLMFHDGSLFVCDTMSDSVRRYDALLQLTDTWNAASPWSLAALDDGTILSVSYDGKLQRLLADGDVETLFEGLDHPFGLAPGDGATVWISEQGAHGAPGRVTHRKLDGTILATVVVDGADGLDNPEGLARDADGRLVIADTGKHRLYRRGTDGATKLLTNKVQFPIVIAPLAGGDVLVNGAKPGATTAAYGLWRVTSP